MTLKYSAEDWREHLERWEDEYEWKRERKKQGAQDDDLDSNAKRGDCKACGHEAASIAATLLHLDRPEAAKEWFGTAGGHMAEMAKLCNDSWEEISELDRIDKPFNYVRGLWWAGLSGDEAVLAEMVVETERLEDWYVDDVGPGSKYYRPRALAAVLGDDESASKFVDALADSEKDIDRAIFLGGQGLLTGDREEIVDGATLWADIHADLYDGKDPMGTKAVAFGAALFLVVARRQGIDATVKSDYLPESVYELA